ncbi:MAG: hypothetical protein V4515_14145 [Chloroflexota bacterium]
MSTTVRTPEYFPGGTYGRRFGTPRRIALTADTLISSRFADIERRTYAVVFAIVEAL